MTLKLPALASLLFVSLTHSLAEAVIDAISKLVTCFHLLLLIPFKCLAFREG